MHTEQTIPPMELVMSADAFAIFDQLLLRLYSGQIMQAFVGDGIAAALDTVRDIGFGLRSAAMDPFVVKAIYSELRQLGLDTIAEAQVVNHLEAACIERFGEVFVLGLR